ncbi:MAG: class I adenylate-forming enzyme family protein [Myxococcota bacterium]
MTLLNALESVDATRTAIVTPAHSHCFGELVGRGRELARRFRGARVAAYSTDIALATQIFTAADGVASCVLLLPQDVSQNLARELCKRARIQAVVTDAPEKLACIADIVVNSPLDLPVREAAASCTPTQWILSTSGTTSTPKLVSHSLAGLTRTTRTGRSRSVVPIWGMLYDYTRFAGLQVLMQSLLSGATLAKPDHDAALDAQLKFLASAGCTHLSATPSLWRNILMSGAADQLGLRQVTLGGEIADQRILDSLAHTYPSARITHIFASTEAGVGFSVNDGKPGFPAEYLNTSTSGVALDVREGTLWVRNELVAADYVGDGGAVSSDGWVDTGDLVEKIGSRYLFKGRRSGVINVGGNKVHPEEVERVLIAHPHVVMARVFAKSNPIVGALVAASIVRGPDAPSEFRSELRHYLKSRLAPHMLPAVLEFTDALALSSGGKVTRQN